MSLACCWTWESDGDGKAAATDRKTPENTDQDKAAGGTGDPASAAPRECGWMARLTGYCWRYPRNVILALAGTLVVSAVGITIPLIQRDIVDNLTSTARTAIWPLALT